MYIIYNGNALPPNVDCLSWSVSTPAVKPRALDIPGVRGMTRVGGKLGNRAVTLTMALRGNSVTENVTALNALNAWCYAAVPAALHLPGQTARHLLAECDQYPHPDMAKAGETFEVGFMCHAPEYISDDTFSAPVGGTVAIGGTLPTTLRIEQTIATVLTDPHWMIDGANHGITIEGEIESGLLIIDLGRSIVTLDGEDISSQVTLESDIEFELEPGVYAISGANGAGGTVFWQERFI